MNYQDMILEVSDAETTRDGDKRIGAFKVRVLASPAGEMNPSEAVAVEYDDKDLQSTLGKLDRRELDTEGLTALGRTLAALLLPIKAKKDGTTNVREFFARSLVKLGPETGLRVRLRLPPDLAVLPWEYAYVERAGGSGMDGFLALDPRIAIVRHELLAASVAEPALSGDIKVVSAFAAAEGLPDLDLDKEMKLLKEALQGLDGLRIEPCPQATLSKLQPLLAGAGVFHFAGHGDFIRQMAAKPGTYQGVGFLAFGDERIDAEQMGVNLRGQGIRLAVLAGCHTGRRDGISVWSGIAPALVKMEIPAVVANQYTITDKCAIAFSHQFYQALAGGLPLERAVSAGRIAAYNADKTGRDWGVPVLYLRAANGNLFSGAADPTVRERSKNAAEVDVTIRAREVRAGGVLIGADVRTIIDGKLSVDVVVAGTVFGKVVGVELGEMQGGSAKANVDVDVVGPGGSVTGASIDMLGGHRPSMALSPTKSKLRSNLSASPKTPPNQTAHKVRTLSRESTPFLPALMEVINNLINLMRRTSDPQQLATLHQQRMFLSEIAARELDVSFDKRPLQDQACIETLQEASDAICNAIQERVEAREVTLKMAKVTRALDKRNAQIIDMLGSGGDWEGEPDRTSVLTRAKPPIPPPLPWSSTTERGATPKTRRKASNSSSTTSNVKVGRVSGGEVIGTQVNRREGDTIQRNQVNVTIVQGPTGIQRSANDGRVVDKASIEEKIRLDVALPESAVVNEPFDVVIAVKQPDAPVLAVADLDQVVSGDGSIFRSVEDDVVKYRVEVTGAGFEVSPKNYVIELRPKANSRPVAFQLTSTRTGKRSLLVNAYQENEALAAQTRVTIEVEVAVSTG